MRSVLRIILKSSTEIDGTMSILSPKALYRFHVYGGLWLGGHFLLLLLTGTILLFRPEPAFEPSAPGAADSARVGAILDGALSRFPGERPLSLFPDDDHPSVLHLRLGKEGTRQFRGARKMAFDLGTGQELAGAHSEKGFFAFLLRLHRDLLLGSTGKILVGISGTLLFLFLLTGFLLYGRFRRGQAYDSVRSGALAYSDLHKWLAAGVGAWALLVTFTGVLLSFNSLLIKFYQYQSLRSLGTAYTGEPLSSIASVDQVIGNALVARPGAKLGFVAFPDTEFSLPRHFLLLLDVPGRTGATIPELAVVDAATARVAEIRELPLYLKGVVLSEPLHFGDYGGLFLKLAWTAFSVLTLVMVVVAFVAYGKKRLARRRGTGLAGAAPVRVRVSKTSPYRAPVLLGASALAGAVLALLGEGAADLIAYALFALPLAALGASAFRLARAGRKPRA